MKTDVEAIIFDFGGVILNIDHLRVEQAFKKIGIPEFEDLYGRAQQTELFRELETGKISAHRFREEIRKLTRRNLEDSMIDFVWNQIILDFPVHRIELLKSIRKNYRLFILSNTNIIHYHHYIHLFWNQFGYDFNTLFDNTYWSFKIGKRKPDKESFNHVLQHEKLNPSNTLFIDDTFKNIEAARKLNILAHFLEPASDMSKLFEDGRLREGVIDFARIESEKTKVGKE